MRRRQRLIFWLVTAALAAPAANPQTATLDVQNETCSLCPITVRNQTSAAALIKATTDAGFPSTLRR